MGTGETSSGRPDLEVTTFLGREDKGAGLMVEGHLLGSSIRLLVDTGASISMLSLLSYWAILDIRWFI